MEDPENPLEHLSRLKDELDSIPKSGLYENDASQGDHRSYNNIQEEIDRTTWEIQDRMGSS